MSLFQLLHLLVTQIKKVELVALLDVEACLLLQTIDDVPKFVRSLSGREPLKYFILLRGRVHPHASEQDSDCSYFHPICRAHLLLIIEAIFEIVTFVF